MTSYDIPVDQLIEACSRTDSGDAWEELVRRFGGTIRRAVYVATETAAVARCHDLRQELVQEVYCRLLEDRRRYLRRFRGKTHGEACRFFTRVARTVVYNHGRRLRARKRRPASHGARGASWLPSHGLREDLTPEVRLLRVEEWREFWGHALDRLKDRPTGRRDLVIFHLFSVEGWTGSEISRSLQGAIQPRSVHTVVQRVRERLDLEPPRRWAA